MSPWVSTFQRKRAKFSGIFHLTQSSKWPTAHDQKAYHHTPPNSYNSLKYKSEKDEFTEFCQRPSRRKCGCHCERSEAICPVSIRCRGGIHPALCAVPQGARDFYLRWQEGQKNELRSPAKRRIVL